MKRPRSWLLRIVPPLLLVMGVGLAIIYVPASPVLGSLEWVQTPLGVLVIVCGLGKLLYDTLFYERYV